MPCASISNCGSNFTASVTTLSGCPISPVLGHDRPALRRRSKRSGPVDSPAKNSDLPVTAYLVLGVLAANDEQLTAGEIKMRAELSVGHFYWSPSVSHVRRELNRLLARGMVSEICAQSGKRAITLYETTDSGLDALRRWVQHFPGQDQVVIKHPVILRTWLSRGEDPEHVVDTLDRHLEA